jgi:formylglycine-generating enzyme required for sulfatase activity
MFPKGTNVNSRRLNLRERGMEDIIQKIHSTPTGSNNPLSGTPRVSRFACAHRSPAAIHIHPHAGIKITRWVFIILLIAIPVSLAADTVFFVQGEPGVKGQTGDQGQQGPTGDKGPAGDKGQQGLQGVQGLKGLKGDTGDQGTQGPKGDKGDNGTFAGFVGSITINGTLSVTGTVTTSGLSATASYSLPACPEGYAKDARTDIVLCKRGSDEMVRVGDFWVDRYEAVIVDSTQYAAGDCNGAGVSYGASSYDYPGTFPRTGNWTSPMFACSIKNVKPSMYMTWFQAQEACALSGKRLCTNEEWQAAAAGTYDPGVNPGSGGSPTSNTKCVTDASGPRNTGLAGPAPGGNTSCVSSWGVEDMIGNVNEWVAMWGQGGPDSGVIQGQYNGTVGTNKGWDGFSPETTGDGDGTWNLAGVAYGCDRSGGNCGWKAGLPFAACRGVSWLEGQKDGVFAFILNNGPTLGYWNGGFRCCRGM